MLTECLTGQWHTACALPAHMRRLLLVLAKNVYSVSKREIASVRVPLATCDHIDRDRIEHSVFVDRMEPPTKTHALAHRYKYKLIVKGLKGNGSMVSAVDSA